MSVSDDEMFDCIQPEMAAASFDECLSYMDINGLIQLQNDPLFGLAIQRFMSTRTSFAHFHNIVLQLKQLRDDCEELYSEAYSDKLWNESYVPGLYKILTTNEMGHVSYPQYFFPGQHIIDACKIYIMKHMQSNHMSGCWTELHLYDENNNPIDLLDTIYHSVMHINRYSFYRGGKWLKPYLIHNNMTKSLVSGIAGLGWGENALRKKKEALKKLYVTRHNTKPLSLKINNDYEQRYYHEGKLHCETGPAVIRTNGSMFWFKHGLPSREDGPASIVKTSDGQIETWFTNGVPRQWYIGPFFIDHSKGKYSLWWRGDSKSGRCIRPEEIESMIIDLTKHVVSVQRRWIAIYYSPYTKVGMKRLAKSYKALAA